MPSGSTTGAAGARAGVGPVAGAPPPNPVSLPLARGDLAAADARELKRLKAQVWEQSGFFCDGYKEKCLRRRIGVRMRAREVHRYREYAELLNRDPAEYDRLLTAVTINVSKFFRNAEVWEELRRRVLPELFSLDVPTVRVWSAGAARGEEAYTLAILLLEYAEEHGMMERLGRFRIIATDIDREILAAARRAEYGELALKETPDSVRERWFEPGPPYRPRPEVRRLVRFEQADLIEQPFPRDHHLILCRNVIIYFQRSVQHQVLDRFREAFAPGGFLVLGKVETLLGPLASAFRPVANRERIYVCDG